MAQFENIDFPGWEVVRKIGEGSFGGVYEIHRTLPGGRVEKCALKKLAVPRNDGEIQELISQSFSTESITAHYKNQMGELVNEYSLTQELSSCKNVVGCYDVRFIQHDDGIGWDIYIRMELLNPLRQALSAEYQEATVLRLGLDMCNALLACQEHSIIHRDIKPENILVSDRGEFKLGDFGIAKVSERTGTGTMTGTMGYMAPEVANRQHYGPQADIYSLGMVLYWMMNRRTLPFLPYPPAIPSAIQRQEAANRRLAGEAFPPPAHGSAELKAIVMKACAYSPAERCQSVQELQQALAACAQPPLIHPQEPTILDIPHPDEPTQDSTAGAFEGIQSKNEPEESPEQKKPVTNRMRTAVIAAALILACCGIGIFGYLNCWFGHTWQAADCATAKICTRCSTVAEEPLGHLWEEATCTTPKTCTRCGATEGKSLGHSWREATYDAPKTCSVCGLTTGTKLELPIYGLNMTLEEFEKQFASLVKEAESWTPETAPQSLNDYPLFPKPLLEMFETIKGAESEIEISGSTLTWKSNLSDVLPTSKTGFETTERFFIYYSSSHSTTEYLQFESGRNDNYTIQLPAEAWTYGSATLLYTGARDWEGLNERLFVGYKVPSKRIDGVSSIELVISNSEGYIVWSGHLDDDNKFKIEIYFYTSANGFERDLSYDMTSGKLLSM